MDNKYKYYWDMKKRKDEYVESLNKLLEPKPINIHGIGAPMIIVLMLVIFLSGYGPLLLGSLIWHVSGN